MKSVTEMVQEESGAGTRTEPVQVLCAPSAVLAAIPYARGGRAACSSSLSWAWRTLVHLSMV
jgi:hypothetical protein